MLRTSYGRFQLKLGRLHCKARARLAQDPIQRLKTVQLQGKNGGEKGRKNNLRGEAKKTSAYTLPFENRSCPQDHPSTPQ